MRGQRLARGAVARVGCGEVAVEAASGAPAQVGRLASPPLTTAWQGVPPSQ